MLAKRREERGGGMERQKMKHRRQLGLRQGMLGIILLCWVLPRCAHRHAGRVYILDRRRSSTARYDAQRTKRRGHHRAQPGFHDRRQP